MLDIYADVAEDVMAMPVIKGVKTHAEKFAGALKSYCHRGHDAERPGAAGRHQPRPGPEFRQGLRRPVSDQGRPARLRLADQLGREHAADRRADHDPFRRQGPGAAAQAWRRSRPCWCRSIARTRKRAQVLEAAQRSPRSWARRWTTARASRPARSSSIGSGAACRWCWNSGRAIWPRGKIVIKRRDTGTKEVDPAGRRWRRGWRRRSEACRRICYAKARAASARHNTVLANSIDEVEAILTRCHRGERRRQVRDGAPKGRSVRG